MKTPIAVQLLALLIALAACKSGDGGKPTPTSVAGEAPSPAATATPTGEPEAADCSPNLTQLSPAGDLTWEQILPGTIPAPVGWEVRHDPGSGPFLSVFEGGQQVGSLELLQFPLEASFDPEQGFGELREWVEPLYVSIQEDRTAVYGADYGVVGDDPESVRFGGLCGMRYGFTGTDPGGTVAERFVGYATFDQSKLYLVTAFYDAATASEGIGFKDEASVRAFETDLTELVESLRFPAR